jgi:hypothetical protein
MCGPAQQVSRQQSGEIGQAGSERLLAVLHQFDILEDAPAQPHDGTVARDAER